MKTIRQCLAKLDPSKRSSYSGWKEVGYTDGDSAFSNALSVDEDRPDPYIYQTRAAKRAESFTGSLVGIYRVENSSGLGPYAGDWLGKTVKILKGHGSLSDMKHPAPWQEGIKEEAYTWGNRRDERLFGFASLKQLQAWFTPMELRGLAEQGWYPVRHWVYKDQIDFTTPTQLAFIKTGGKA